MPAAKCDIRLRRVISMLGIGDIFRLRRNVSEAALGIRNNKQRFPPFERLVRIRNKVKTPSVARLTTAVFGAKRGDAAREARHPPVQRRRNLMDHNKVIPRRTSAGSRSISFRGTAPPPENGRGCGLPGATSAAGRSTDRGGSRDLPCYKCNFRPGTGASRRGGTGVPRYRRIINLIPKTDSRSNAGKRCFLFLMRTAGSLTFCRSQNITLPPAGGISLAARRISHFAAGKIYHCRRRRPSFRSRSELTDPPSAAVRRRQESAGGRIHR